MKNDLLNAYVPRSRAAVGYVQIRCDLYKEEPSAWADELSVQLGCADFSSFALPSLQLRSNATTIRGCTPDMAGDC
ncbi:MAG: hypothetical protein ACR2Q4_01430 [Geminicoccaceae bacterium]